ncbi:NAD(P)/FAD-dependent oxidoreductase [Streptacidiphilus neutrinimicus]|uniref:NAD(P)/FAD-dependent oxidoreductase n=1 Tax=Streptacidiphilus neutrinimicus TaxID=105420 RepID=UPI0005A6EC47|nr:NAD(P)/FAD-dependent oxidoreductase [Streptacidiphilus neutrinimicus]
MSRTVRVDAVVVGAGMAGLACAADLCAAGLEVMLLEASRQVGGRMASDRRDGYVLDHGFQVFNTAYPQVRRRVDLAALRLRPFDPGYVLADGDRRLALADPTRRPGDLLGAVAGLLGDGQRPRDLAALAALSGRDMLVPARLLKRGPDMTTRQALRGAGLDDDFVDAVLAPFLHGVFLEPRLDTSARFFHLVWRSMLRGSLCLPERGIGAVPRQLADGLPLGTLRLGAGVERLTDDGVALTGGLAVHARAVVVATGPTAARALLPALPPVPTHAVTTVHHAAPEVPWPRKALLVDGDGPLLHTSVVSNVQPAYAPRGVALVSTSLPGVADEEQLTAAEARLADLYRTSTRAWERIAVHRVAEALPASPAPWPLSRGTRLAPGRYVCGDHRATASVQGALASGARAAREVLRDLSTAQTSPRKARTPAPADTAAG